MSEFAEYGWIDNKRSKYLRDKIKSRMDQLQDWMESNHHLKNPEEVMDHTYSVSKFWSVLSEEDKDYIHGARYAIEEKMEWNIPEENKRINRDSGK